MRTLQKLIPSLILFADDSLSYELWLPCTNTRIDLLLLDVNKRWQQYQRVLFPKSLRAATTTSSGRGKSPGGSVGGGGAAAAAGMTKLTAVTVVDSAIWCGDSRGHLYGFNAIDCALKFSYCMEPTQPCAIVALVNLAKAHRVVVGLENGRIFLVDSRRVPTSQASAEGSFVLTELGGSGQKLCSICDVWPPPRLGNGEEQQLVCELWCGEAKGVLNVFTLRDGVVSDHCILMHFELQPGMGALPSSSSGGGEGHVSLLKCADKTHVFSYVAPGCVVYQWNVAERRIENRLDCSKLIPCSESLRSIAIEEHLSPGKCQITTLAVVDDEVYIGTTWGCLIICEKISLRPMTIFRPYDDDVRCIIPLRVSRSSEDEPETVVVTVGRGYRSLVNRYTDVGTPGGAGPSARLTLGHQSQAARGAVSQEPIDRSINMHAIVWRAGHWNPL